jgi:hypothetical protein
VKPIDDFSGKGLSATDSERQIIAAILEGATDHLSAMARILPDASAFLDRECSLIWGFALRIRAAGQPVCLLTIKTSMLADGAVSDPNDILILLQGSHSLINREHAEWHAKQVAVAHARRAAADSLRVIEGANTSPQELAALLRGKAQVIEDIAISTGESLPEPLPLIAKQSPVQAFDPEWLPKSLAPWIADIADRMQCPADFPAVAAMAALSSVAGRRFAIQPKEQDEGHFEFPHLWAMLIGRPSLMKSPSMHAALRPLRKLQSLANEAYEQSDRDRKAQQIAGKLKRQALEQEAKKAVRGSLDFDFTQLLDEGDTENAPERRLIVNDASLEALGEVLRDNPMGTLLYQDELAGLFAMLERDGNQSLRSFLLQAWSGKESFTFDRIGRGSRVIEACAVSVLGSIQPGVIASHVRAANSDSAGADGFLQRFSLAVWPDIPPHWRDVDRPLDKKAEEDATEVFQSMEGLTHAHLIKAGVMPNRDGIPVLRFAPDAQERFRAWRCQLENRLRTETLLPAFEAHLAKYRKLVPALAVLIHVADWQTGPVSLSALDRSLSWAAYLETHAARLYGAGTEADCQGAMALHKKLLNDDSILPEPFTARDVYRKGWSGLATSHTAEAACELLTGHNYLIATPHQPTEKGGRPTFFYRLNPRSKTKTHAA